MAVNAEKQAAIVNAILRQQNDTALRETRQLLVSPSLDSPLSQFKYDDESAENPPPLRRAPPQVKLQSSNDEITRLKIRLAAYERERERRPERPAPPPEPKPKPEPEPEQQPAPEPEPARTLPKSSSAAAPAAAAARAARIDVASDPDPDDDVWAFVDDEQREFPRALPRAPANTPVQSLPAPTSNRPLRRAAFDPVATWADEENLVPPTRPRATTGDTPRVAVRSGLRERSKNVSYAEPSLKAKVRRPWSPTKPKRRSSKAKRRETEAAAAGASTSTSTSTPTSTPTSTSTPSATSASSSTSASAASSSGVRSFDAALARVASAVSFVTERKRGGARARRAKSPEDRPVESSPEIDPNALARRGLTDSDSDPEEEPEPDSDSPARPSPFSNFTSRHVKGPTNRVLSFDNSPRSNEPVPTAAAYVRIPTAVEIAPFRDSDDSDSDSDSDDGESEYEDAEGSAVDDDDVATDVSSDVGDEVPLLARRLSQEEITDALLADAVATGMKLDPHPGARQGVRTSERASASASTASHGIQPSAARKMRRSD